MENKLLDMFVNEMFKAEGEFGYKPFVFVLGENLYLKFRTDTDDYFRNWVNWDKKTFYGIPIALVKIDNYAEFVGYPSDLLSHRIEFE